MSPSYNLLHLSPRCHWVYLSILLVYFPVPPALCSPLSSDFHCSCHSGSSVSPPLHASPSACPMPTCSGDLASPGLCPFSRILGSNGECVPGEGPLTQKPSRHSLGPALPFQHCGQRCPLNRLGLGLGLGLEPLGSLPASSLSISNAVK